MQLVLGAAEAFLMDDDVEEFADTLRMTAEFTRQQATGKVRQVSVHLSCAVSLGGVMFPAVTCCYGCRR